jgi:flagellar biogenesis protein FliO
MNDIYRQFAGVLIVLAILGATLWLARNRGIAQWLSLRKPSRERTITVLERVPLTPQHTLHLLAVGERRLLVTSSPSSCQLITEITAREHSS